MMAALLMDVRVLGTRQRHTVRLPRRVSSYTVHLAFGVSLGKRKV